MRVFGISLQDTTNIFINLPTFIPLLLGKKAVQLVCCDVVSQMHGTVWILYRSCSHSLVLLPNNLPKVTNKYNYIKLQKENLQATNTNWLQFSVNVRATISISVVSFFFTLNSLNNTGSPGYFLVWIFEQWSKNI